jgi:hypothetical protein
MRGLEQGEYLRITLPGADFEVPVRLAITLLICGAALTVLAMSLLATLLFAGVLDSADLVDALRAIRAPAADLRR